MKVNINTGWFSGFCRSVGALLALQTLIIFVVFSKFLSGQAYFAYLDIGSDSFAQVIPGTMHMVRSVLREGFSGWYFEIGLGGVPILWFVDAFAWLNLWLGEGNILPARIGIYLLKLVLGGFTCLVLLRSLMSRAEVAVLFALVYSFCGFIIINGQWDMEATAYVFYPLVLWACLRQLRMGQFAGYCVLPVVVAASLMGGVFFVALGVFIFWVCVLFLACNTASRVSMQRILFQLTPLICLGYLMAAPILLPVVLQLLDTSRVVGGDSLMTHILGQGLTLNSLAILMAELGGFFHKDIFGIGSQYAGYWNYLEGPGFYIGTLSLLLIPQLWHGSPQNRRLLFIGGLILVFYCVFPFLRFMSMGFAATYFRISTPVSYTHLTLPTKA